MNISLKKILVGAALVLSPFFFAKAQESSANEVPKTYRYIQKNPQEYSIEKWVKKTLFSKFKEIGIIKKEDLDYWKGKDGFIFLKGDTTHTIDDGREIVKVGNEEYNTTLIDYDHCLGVEETIIKKGNKSLEIIKVYQNLEHYLNGRTGDENPSGQEIQDHYVKNSLLFNNFVKNNNLHEKIENHTPTPK